MTDKTKINYIGSRFAGEEYGTINDLLKLIAIEPLEEKWSPYCSLNTDGSIRIGGNFERVSHGFSIDTFDKNLLANFADAFYDNERIDKPKLYSKPVPKSTLIIMGIVKEEAA